MWELGSVTGSDEHGNESSDFRVNEVTKFLPGNRYLKTLFTICFYDYNGPSSTTHVTFCSVDKHLSVCRCF